MNDDQLLSQLREKLRKARTASKEERVKRVRELESRLHSARTPGNAGRSDWNAALAIVAVGKRDQRGRVHAFKCLVPIFGRPSGATVVVSRDRLIDEIRSGHHVVTALDAGNDWVRDAEVTLTPSGYLIAQTDSSDADDLGRVPVESQLQPRM